MVTNLFDRTTTKMWAYYNFEIAFGGSYAVYLLPFGMNPVFYSPETINIVSKNFGTLVCTFPGSNKEFTIELNTTATIPYKTVFNKGFSEYSGTVNAGDVLGCAVLPEITPFDSVSSNTAPRYRSKGGIVIKISGDDAETLSTLKRIVPFFDELTDTPAIYDVSGTALGSNEFIFDYMPCKTPTRYVIKLTKGATVNLEDYIDDPNFKGDDSVRFLVNSAVPRKDFILDNYEWVEWNGDFPDRDRVIVYSKWDVMNADIASIVKSKFLGENSINGNDYVVCKYNSISNYYDGSYSPPPYFNYSYGVHLEVCGWYVGQATTTEYPIEYVRMKDANYQNYDSGFLPLCIIDKFNLGKKPENSILSSIVARDVVRIMPSLMFNENKTMSQSCCILQLNVGAGIDQYKYIVSGEDCEFPDMYYWGIANNPCYGYGFENNGGPVKFYYTEAEHSESETQTGSIYSGYVSGKMKGITLDVYSTPAGMQFISYAVGIRDDDDDDIIPILAYMTIRKYGYFNVNAFKEIVKNFNVRC